MCLSIFLSFYTLSVSFCPLFHSLSHSLSIGTKTSATRTTGSADRSSQDRVTHVRPAGPQLTDQSASGVRTAPRHKLHRHLFFYTEKSITAQRFSKHFCWWLIFDKKRWMEAYFHLKDSSVLGSSSFGRRPGFET